MLFFSWYSGDQFLTWGWRIPFLMSIIMVAIGLWIRLGILETPVFRRLVAENKIERAPILEVLKRQPQRSDPVRAAADGRSRAPATSSTPSC